MGKRVAQVVIDGLVTLLLWQVLTAMLSLTLALTGWGDEIGGLPDGVITALFAGALPVSLAAAVWWRRRRRLPLPEPVMPSPTAMRGLPAGFGERISAAMLDAGAVLLLALPVGAVLFVPLGLAMERVVGWTHPDAGLDGVALALLYFLVVVLSGVFVVHGTIGDARGGSWGKRRIGLRVVRRDGAPLGLGRALLRQALKLAEVASVLGLVALAARPPLHDRLAGSRVVRV